MNERVDTVDDVLLDRLVDGELSAEEYRQVLELLDARPDGWRRCALAFLEAQALRGELRDDLRSGLSGGLSRGGAETAGTMIDEVAGSESLSSAGRKPPPPNPAAAARQSWQFGGLITLASAASFLLAFVLASSIRPIQQPGAQTASSRGPVEGPSFAAMNSTSDDGRWGDYRMVMQGEDGRPQQIVMPIYSADDPRAAWLADEEVTRPIELIRALRQLGFQVDRERQWTPVGQHADRPVVVPVEKLHITPVSGRSYE